MRRALVLLGCFVVFSTAKARAQSAQQSTLQTPTLERPEAGSVSGSLAAWALGAGELTRGSMTMALAASLPEERGVCPIPFLPSYAPDAGASEWGLGWETSLSIRRTNLFGHINYRDDEWLSPWGRLVRGSDGAFYPLAFKSPVRVFETNAGLEAVNAEGLRFVFSEAEQTERGVYAYWLSSVRGVLGEHADLSYTQNESGRRFVESLHFGSAGFERGQRVTLEYETLLSPLDSFASGERRRLDRRVTRIIVQSRARPSAPYVERYRYVLEHDQGFGPAPRLRTIRRHWPDGSQEPAVHYSYGEINDALASKSFVPVPDVRALIETFGTAGLNPGRATWFDVDDDGAIDLEHHAEQTLARKTTDGFQIEPLPAQSESNEALHMCRPNGGLANPARHLGWLVPQARQPQVVVTRSIQDLTRIVVCDRDGSAVHHDAQVEGNWTLGETTTLVDVNGDRRADLVHVRAGMVSTLLAQGDTLRFEPGPVTVLSPRMTPTDLSFRDFNGDGIVDLVGRTRSALVMWPGLGHGRFHPEVTTLFVYNAGRRVQDLSHFAMTYADLDGDGLTDLVLTRDAAAYLFANDGVAFQQLKVPALERRDLNLRHPLFVSLSQRADPELSFVRGKEVWALPLRSADTGLLTRIDDGRGSLVRLRYARAPSRPFSGGRARVLSSIERSAKARGTWTTDYAYDEPVAHSKAAFLLGFARVRRDESWGSEEATFEHTDYAPGTLVSAYETNTDAPDILRFQTHEHEEAEAFGVRFKRARHSERGFTNTGGSVVLSETTDVLGYERGLCPTVTIEHNAHGTLRRESSLSNPLELQNAMHCLAETEHWALRHSDPELDQDMERQLRRNARGQIDEVWWLREGQTPWRSERMTYDARHRLQTLTLASGARTELGYDDHTGRLTRLTKPDGTVTHVDRYDDVTLAIEDLRTQRDQVAFHEGFDYDAWERLAQEWDDVAGTTAQDPGQLWSYDLGSSLRLGHILSETQVQSGSIRSQARLVDAAGEEVGDARETAAGWVLSGLLQRDVGRKETTRSRMARAVPRIADASNLPEDAIEVDAQREDVWENLVMRSLRVQETSTRRLAGHLTLTSEGVVATLVENGTHATSSVRDASLRTRSLRDETAHATDFSYDALGRLVAVYLPDGTKHGRSFDALGRVSRITRDGVGSITLGYDPQTGLLVHKTFFDRHGHETRSETLRYDSAGRLRGIEASAGDEKEEVNLSYDGDGKSGQRGFLTEERTQGLVRSMVHNPDGTLREQTEQLVGFRTLHSAFTYTQDRQVESITRTVIRGDEVLELTTQHYGFDAYGRPSFLDVNGVRLATAHYDDLGRIDRIALSDGRAVIPFYDPVVGERSGVSFDAGAWLSDTRIELDARGHVARELRETNGQERWVSYGYDPRGLLETANGGGVSARYAYDRASRPVYAEDVRGARTLRTGDVDEAVEGLVYDGSGRLIERWGTTFTYGPRGHLIASERAGQTVRYAYDAEGRRVLKSANGRPVMGYLSGGVLTESGFAETLRFAGQVLGVLAGGRLTMMGNDLRGTSFATSKGALDAPSPFGVRASDIGRSEVLDFAELGFDEALGTVRMGVRDYDPLLGAFHTPDPAVLEAPETCLSIVRECNLYAYARSTPTAYVDPEGKLAFVFVVGGFLLLDMLASENANAPGADGYVDTSLAPENYAVMATGLALGGVAGVRAMSGARALAPARVTRTADELVHLTTPESAAKIAESSLRGTSGIYAGPASNATAQGLGVTLRTGLLPSQSGAAVRIPEAAKAAFSRPIPIGPVTLWQRATGQQFTAAGSIDMATGAFTRTGTNWNQIFIYGADAAFTGVTIEAGASRAFED